MNDRNILRNVSAALAATALLLAAADTATAARANRSPTTGGTTTTVTTKPVKLNYGSGGHGWCYWHPYACHRY